MELVGITGALLVLVAFVSNELGWWSKRDVRYDIVNMVGAVLLIFYAWQLESLPFIILNAVWLIMAAKDLVRRFFS